MLGNFCLTFSIVESIVHPQQVLIPGPKLRRRGLHQNRVAPDVQYAKVSRMNLWVEQGHDTAFCFLPQACLSFAKQEQADIGALKV